MAGRIRPGEPADILLLDWAAIDDDRLREDIDALQLVLTRATARHVRELIVGGRTVVKDGSVIGVDADAARAEVLSRMRSAMPDKARSRRRCPCSNGPSPNTSSPARPASDRAVGPQRRRRLCSSCGGGQTKVRRPFFIPNSGRAISATAAARSPQSSTTKSAGLPTAMP